MTVHIAPEEMTQASPEFPATATRAVWPALVNATATWTEVRSELFTGLDWDAFVHSAEYHGVLPIVAQRLLESQVARQLEPAMKDRLRRAFQANLVRTFPLVAEVRRIVDAFHDASINVIPYKGPVLAEELWGNVALRECADLDFLVRPGDVDHAGRLLHALGYWGDR